ncbi:MAG TPA: hypothetical protein VEC14_01540, partial [Reyranellaceae bacterium]|nr:hypothetical protein [Reyranellaceae bacterium]
TISLLVRSDNSRRGSATIRRPDARVYIHESTQAWLLSNRPQPLSYTPQPGDLGEIIGKVEWAEGPR